MSTLLVPSPDEGAAIAVCFSEPMGSPMANSDFNRRIECADTAVSEIKTVNPRFPVTPSKSSSGIYAR